MITLWTYYAPISSQEIAPAEYAQALERLHVGMRQLDVPAPHFTDRVAEAQLLVDNPVLTPELAAADRKLLSNTLERLRHAISNCGAE